MPAISRRASRATACALLAAALAGASSAPADVRVGAGDVRDGYESRDFVTRSERLDRMTPRSAALEALSRRPPLGLPALEEPGSAAMIDLGRRLFFDRRLSANGTLSCGMCHVPEQGFTQNELATPVGIEGAFVRRNAPSLYNVGYLKVLFHDGREASLAAQIWAPLLADNEMGNSSRSEVVELVRGISDYRRAFEHLFAKGVDESSLGEAIAAYQRALVSADSPFDRFYYGGDRAALSESERRGFEVFQRSGCAACHRFEDSFALFTDEGFHNTGISFASAALRQQPPAQIQLAPGVFVPLNSSIELPDRADLGRMEATGSAADRWKFRTPTLRNVALSAPYMHDGSLAKLEDVVAFYDGGGSPDDPTQDPLIRPLGLDAEARSDLVRFLEARTASNVDALAADARTAPIGDNR